jgi:integrase
VKSLNGSKENEMARKDYKKLKGTVGIYQNTKTKKYFAEKKISGKNHTASFDTLYEAKEWRENFDGTDYSPKECIPDSSHATLKEVWETMQQDHFPTLATSTKMIWHRRYTLWKIIEHLPMNQITPSRITSWVNHWVEEFKQDDYQKERGKAGRCNLNNELNMFVTIFNWYKESEKYEKEAHLLTNPVKKKHRQLGFIKPVPDKKKQIDLEDALLFFEYLKPLYKELAMMQFYCAARVGEIAGLQWSNIDMKNRRMLIKHTVVWDEQKVFLELKPFPKNKEPRPVFITDEIMQILKQRDCFRELSCDYVFHVEGKPINYGTVLVNYVNAQRKSGVPYSGTHILRHGMAKLARQVGGGLDAVMAMTGHKDVKLANHYSKCDEDDQREFSEKIMEHIRKHKNQSKEAATSFSNVVSLSRYKSGTNG